MKIHLRFLAFSTSFLIILFAARSALAQIAPAAVAMTQGRPGEYYFFRSEAAAVINKARSKQGELVLLTEPPLTPSVFSKFAEVWQVAGFAIEGNSLVWTGPAHIDKEFRRQTETYLTEAENAIKAEKTRSKNSAEQYLQKMSEQMGLPLV